VEESLRLHPVYRGKVQLMPKCPIRGPEDWSVWYTPGVAAPCKAIVKRPEQVYDYTNKGNTIAVVSDGTRVLGLGDIGPEAGLPVMESKALLFKYLGGVDAIPLCIRAADEDAIIAVVKALEPSFGGRAGIPTICGSLLECREGFSPRKPQGRCRRRLDMIKLAVLDSTIQKTHDGCGHQERVGVRQ
jgi:hypothetical protein